MSEFRENNADYYKKISNGESYGLLYNIGNSIFFIALENIIDIMIPQKVRKIPGAVDYLTGIFIYDETPYCYIDTHKRLGLTHTVSPQAMLISTKNDGIIAFTIDSTHSIIPRHELEIAPGETGVQNPLLNQSLRAEYLHEGKRVLDIDLDRIL